MPRAYHISGAGESIEMWRKDADNRSEVDPVRIGGKKTVMSLAIIAVIAIILLLVIRFTIL